MLKGSVRAALNATAAATLLATAAHAFADPTVTMAPPVDVPFSQTADGQPADAAIASQDSVFNWREVPASQNVPITRAVFDRGGYQLYDTAGETIVVPFSNNNLYVMKFGLSQDGTTYFVNEGDAPVLYVPRDGYLENASVPGARWFPFPEDFRPAQPVFLGIAPSWGDYCAMGWYPDMAFYGGYWGRHPYFAGSAFTASFGLSIFIGGHHYDGWEPYRHFYAYHPAPYHVTIVDRNVYHFGGGFGGGHEYFRGAGHPYPVNRGPGGDRQYGSNGRFGGDRDFEGVHSPGGGRDFAGGRVFSGASRPYYAHRDIPGGRDFDGIRATAPAGGRAFGGVYPANGNHTFGSGRTFQGARPAYTGGPGRSPSGGPAFSGGGRFDGPRITSQGGRSFGGGRSSVGGGVPRPSVSRGDSHGSDRGDDHGGRH